MNRDSTAPIESDAFFGLRFGAVHVDSGDPAVVEVPLNPLGADSPWEIWASPDRVERSFARGIGMVETPDHIVVHTRMPLARHAEMSGVARQAYVFLIERVLERGYRHLVRTWNFVPDINRGRGDDETYAQFSHGRATALDELSIPASQYPAATAVGTPGGSPLIVVVLASRCQPMAIENPRQTSAYHYPRRYGPRAPTFARAMLLPERSGGKLFISGTASIVGHESRHDDVRPQLEETLTNIEGLMRTTLEKASGFTIGEDRSWRVYLRNPADLAHVEGETCRRLGSRNSMVFLQAHICRRELLVEIEGVCQMTALAPAGG